MGETFLLGEYLKECNIWCTPRKNPGEGEMRRLVLQEFNQPMSRKCGVRRAESMGGL